MKLGSDLSLEIAGLQCNKHFLYIFQLELK